MASPTPSDIDFVVNVPIEVHTSTGAAWNGYGRFCWEIPLLPEGISKGCSAANIANGRYSSVVDLSGLVGRRFDPKRSRATLEVNGRSFSGAVIGFKEPQDHPALRGRTVRTAEVSLAFKLPAEWIEQQEAQIEDPNAAMRQLQEAAARDEQASSIHQQPSKHLAPGTQTPEPGASAAAGKAHY